MCPKYQIVGHTKHIFLEKIKGTNSSRSHVYEHTDITYFISGTICIWGVLWSICLLYLYYYAEEGTNS